MDNNEMILELSNHTIAEHKAMQKALKVLLYVGIDQFSALSFILRAMRDKKMKAFQNHNEVTVAKAKY